MSGVVVLDLHGGLGALRQARPFFYPLAEQLCWLESVRPDDVPERIAAWLRRHAVRDYRLIVLLGLAVPDADPFQASLALALDRLEHRGLAPLRGLQAAPTTVHAIVLDGLERDGATGCPSDPRARLGWELDTCGLAASSGGLLLDLDAPAALARIWGPPIELSGERNDAGLVGLSQSLQAEVRTRLNQVAADLRKRLDACLSAVREAYPDPEHDLRHLLEGAHARLWGAATEQWESLERSALQLAAYRPDKALRRLAAENMGLLPASRGIGLLHLPWQLPYGQPAASDLLGLVGLILMLARRPSRIEDVDRLLQDDTRAYAVTVRFDPDRLRWLFADWQRRLCSARQDLDQRAAEPIRIRRYLNDHCRAAAVHPLPETLDRSLGTWDVPWVRRTMGRSAWWEWLGNAHDLLAARRRTVETHLNRLGERLRPNTLPYETVAITDLGEERERRWSEWDTCQASLEKSPQPIPELPSPASDPSSGRVLELLERQPGWRALAGWLLFGPLVLSAAWLAGPAPVGAPHVLLPTATSAVLAAIVAFAPVWWLRRQITGLVAECRESLLQQDRELRSWAERRCLRLEQLCRLGVAARNRAELEAIAAEQGRKARRAEYQRRQLDRHLEDLSRLTGSPPAIPLAESAAVEPFDPERLPAHNRAYWPVIQARSGDMVELDIGETHLQIEVPWIPAIVGLVLAPVDLEAFGRDP